MPIDNNIELRRPMLMISKSEVLAYCHKYSVKYAIDSSNLEDHYTRNKIRNRIIPILNEVQPDFSDKIIQFRSQLLEASEYLYNEARKYYNDSILENENKIHLDLHKIKQLPTAIARLIITFAINDLTEDQLSVSFEKINYILELMNHEKPNVMTNLGKNFFLIKAYNEFIFQHGQNNENEFMMVIDAFKEYTLPNGVKIMVKKIQEKAKINNNSLILCYNSTMWPLVLRTRKNGDKIKTSFGHKKISRLFIDAKIPADKRSSWPILTNQSDYILWVIGLQKAENILECEKTTQYILIEVI
jgi:tRNA(Ile)-lysidine synthase